MVLIFRIFLGLLVWVSAAAAGPDARPFWTERSSFLEGDILYTVGVASSVVSVEDGRSLAFQHGKQEILNFIQLADISNIEIQTQMTYQEQAEPNHYNVYRLLKVDYTQLKSLKENQLNQAKANLDKLDSQHQLQIAIQEEQIALKKRYLAQMHDNDQKLNALDAAFRQVMASIVHVEDRACRYIKRGMTQDEVRMLAGEPRSRDNKGTVWRYGTISVNFKYGVVDNFGGRKFVLCRRT